MKYCLGIVILAASCIAAGCNRNPAYSNVNVNKARPGAESTAQSGEAGQAPAAAQSPAADIPPAQVAARQPQEVKPPPFVDTGKGEARDIPSFPKAARQSIMFGPVDGTDTFSLVLESSSGMDAIADFYDKAVKAHKWTLVDRVRDPEASEWVLKKGETAEGKIQVRKNPNRNSFYIIIARTEKAAPPPAAQK